MPLLGALPGGGDGRERREVPGPQTLWLARYSLLWLALHALAWLKSYALLWGFEADVKQACFEAGRSRDRIVAPLVAWSASAGRVEAAAFAGVTHALCTR